ncbi:MAG: alcohol dehydrogenase [Peptococcaceae bacterium BICA1-7]|nr:MAG: alcohol dehydrogenase [Peptococcaceae bacterium BICA1-7]
MEHWKQTLVSPETSLRDVIHKIDESAMQIALVVDLKKRLIGTISDGDIRRAIMKGLSLEETASNIMNTDPTVVTLGVSMEQIQFIMKTKVLRRIPIVDDEGVVRGLALLEALFESNKRENWVVLMAGGKGTRLAPLTDESPKPLLHVGEQPILETILESFTHLGFQKFFISVNYKSYMIEDYFGDGSKWGVSISYLREDTPLGTAGALSLLPEIPKTPLIVMNGDLLTKVNFLSMLDFHREQKSIATMGVREYDFHVPYGVVNVNGFTIEGIEEKPVNKFFVNAGIYVLEPLCLQMLPANQYYDMPVLFGQIIEQGHTAKAFPIREYWLDIGCPNDFKRANGDYRKEFNPR